MKDCTEYWDLISASLDGALTPEEQSRLEAHLAQCPECRELLAQLEQVGTELGQVEQPGPGFADAVMAEAARTEQEIPFTDLPRDRKAGKGTRERMGQWWKPIRTWGAIAACFLVIFGLGRMIHLGGLFSANSSASGGAAPADTAAAADVAEPGAAPTELEPAEGNGTGALAEGSQTESAFTEESAAEESAGKEPDAVEDADRGTAESGTSVVLEFDQDAEILAVYYGEAGGLEVELSREVELSQEDKAALLSLFAGLELVPGAPDCASDIRIEGSDFTLWVHTECRSVTYQGEDGQVCYGALTEEQLGQLRSLLGE